MAKKGTIELRGAASGNQASLLYLHLLIRIGAIELCCTPCIIVAPGLVEIVHRISGEPLAAPGVVGVTGWGAFKWFCALASY